MKKQPVHLISEPRGCVALRTACGRELSPKVARTETARSVTCSNCQHAAALARGGKWHGLKDYSWRERKPGEVDRDLTKAAAKALAPGAFSGGFYASAGVRGAGSEKVVVRRDSGLTVQVAVKVKGRAGVQSLARMVAAAGRILETVETIEARAMAADGPVTSTLREATEQELRRIWLAAKTIASTKLPELAVVPELQEWRTTLDPRTAKLAKPGAELPPHDGLPPEPIGSRPRCVLVPPDPRPTRRERVARVRARKAARRRATR